MPGNWKKKTFVQTIFESSIINIIKNMFIMKNLTDFCKTVETGVDPPLISLIRWIELLLPRKNTARIITREIITNTSSPAIFDYGALLLFESSELAARLRVQFTVKQLSRLLVKVGL